MQFLHKSRFLVGFWLPFETGARPPTKFFPETLFYSLQPLLASKPLKTLRNQVAVAGSGKVLVALTFIPPPDTSGEGYSFVKEHFGQQTVARSPWGEMVSEYNE
jgi:hypothetical protein